MYLETKHEHYLLRPSLSHNLFKSSCVQVYHRRGKQKTGKKEPQTQQKYVRAKSLFVGDV